MNTPIVSNSPATTPPREVLNLPAAPVGSEDVTVRRDLPVRAPKARMSGVRLASPVIRFKHVLAGVMLASMVGCGSTGGERAVSGAGIGAGAGAVLGAVTGMGPGTGAAIGAAAGAAAGGLTTKKQINLGRPIWR